MSKQSHRVVILGGGFEGLYAAKQLGGRKRIEVTVVDRRKPGLLSNGLGYPC